MVQEIGNRELGTPFSDGHGEVEWKESLPTICWIGEWPKRKGPTQTNNQPHHNIPIDTKNTIFCHNTTTISTLCSPFFSPHSLPQ
ncbi:hypothetical protein VNO78_31251 [Psophocarpus tetragonolobus]|uniref:Uncharacterized protein n=1 Tax=Psophocarpus tetragonolobus TaxID=3891 RepID=A0AAN9X970_PSOTE